MARAMLHLAVTTVIGFFAALGLFVGYLVGFAFLVIARAEADLPGQRRLLGARRFAASRSASALTFRSSPASSLDGGYAVIPVALACGLAIFVVTHRGARRFLTWWRNRSVS